MKTNRMLWLLSLSATIMILAAGCASSSTRSFNSDFNQNFPPRPNYTVVNVDETEFKIKVLQGTPMPEQHAVCVNYMKTATSAIAKAEARRRGWVEWQLNYIQERDQGWMHVLVAEVIRVE
jgi:hypothetical protein